MLPYFQGTWEQWNISLSDIKKIMTASMFSTVRTFSFFFTSSKGVYGRRSMLFFLPVCIVFEGNQPAPPTKLVWVARTVVA